MANNLYTKDPVAQMVEDYTIGKMGVFTGKSVAESIGYTQRPQQPAPSIVKNIFPDTNNIDFRSYREKKPGSSNITFSNSDDINFSEITCLSWSLLFFVFIVFSALSGEALLSGENPSETLIYAILTIISALIPCSLKEKSWKLLLHGFVLFWAYSLVFTFFMGSPGFLAAFGFTLFFQYLIRYNSKRDKLLI